jgi:hypothetical protein
VALQGNINGDEEGVVTKIKLRNEAVDMSGASHRRKERAHRGVVQLFQHRRPNVKRVEYTVAT